MESKESDEVKEVVALALRKPAIAPPGKKQTDYKTRERERKHSLQ